MGLPTDTEFQLLALTVTERTGREVGKLFEKETGRSISFGTLYTSFRRMREAGWVAMRDDEDEDGRLRWFRITGAGVEALALARERYQQLAKFGLRGRLA